MRPILFLFSLAVLPLLSACAGSGDSGLNYRDAVVTPTLEMPPDLISRDLDRNLEVPGSNIGKPENRGRFAETGNLNVEPRTLPEFDGVDIEGDCGVNWLVIGTPAEQLWPQLRAFWAEQGFRLIKDEPAIGVMETEWLSMKTGGDSFLSSLFASLRAAEYRDQYLTRVERAGGKTRVKIAHRGQELVVETDDPRTDDGARGWQLMPPDPDKEHEMLSRLMIFLGMQDPRRRAELENLGLLQPLARLSRDEEDASPYLLVRQGFGQSWNRLVHVLDRLAIPVRSMERDENHGRLELDAAALSGLLDQKVPDPLLVEVQGSPGANVSRVILRRPNGATDSSDQAMAVLQFFYRQLK